MSGINPRLSHGSTANPDLESVPLEEPPTPPSPGEYYKEKERDLEKASTGEDSNSANVAILEKEELTPDKAFTVAVEGDQSPFPEVAACVPNWDDPTLPCNTVRAWILVTVFVILFSGVNQFFGLRYPSLSLGYVVAQLLVHPIGKAWEKLPRWRVPLGPLAFDINPGKWSIKEHSLIAICVNLTAGTAYAMGSLVAITSPVYWNRDYGAGFSFLYLLTTQALGFGLAGLSRRWLVYPAALIWPSSLPSTVLLRALHEKQDHSPANGWTITRYRYFIYLTLGAFVWYWFPDYIWTSLSTFAFITWIAPNNQKVNAIFGMSSGLGLLPISFDWTQITYAFSPASPLTTPFYISCNAFATIVIFYLFLSPILYYSNVWQSAHLPLLSSSTFDNQGKTYNVSRVVNKLTLDFELEKYKEYSPMYVSMSYSLTYGLSFAAVTAVVVYTVLYNGKEIWARFKDAKHGGEDIHKRLMASYKEVPDWWYGVLTVVILGLGIFTTRYWDTGLPVWGFIVICFGMGVTLIIPEGILEGTTNQRIFLNIITELIAGYIWPGKPIANMMVKMYGYNTVKHGMDFAQDLKLGQYMKIPPRTLFFAQIYSTVLAAAVQTGVLRWMIGHIEDLCSPTNKNRFTCAGAKVVYNASIIWGTIGPQRMFQSGQTYNALMYFFLIGPVVTVLVWLLYRRYPNSWIKYINVPIFFNAAGNIPPATTTQYSLWFIFGFLFNYLIRKRAFNWWKRYNYLTQAAMDTGTALATIIIFFALSYNNITFDWWGNTVGSNTMDTKGTPWLSVPTGTHFGPGPGEF
ncbi:OPT family small oligopeptide transporter [Kwoniella botswanensis]|uniref:OPT family small oligopeptide transporter n=1 Tax=Kwoniella botswanensis TaxID=1268659 RepID=UPI00315D775C